MKDMEDIARQETSLARTKDLVRTGVLDAHPDFVETPIEDLLWICNGCGAANAKFDFVPDTIWGMRISPACHIHDFDYNIGKVIEDKFSADRRMLNNLLRLIERGSSRILRRFRRRRALTYYNAVTDFGGPAFWSGKNGKAA